MCGSKAQNENVGSGKILRHHFCGASAGPSVGQNSPNIRESKKVSPDPAIQDFPKVLEIGSVQVGVIDESPRPFSRARATSSFAWAVSKAKGFSAMQGRPARNLLFSPDGKVVAANSVEKTVEPWMKNPSGFASGFPTGEPCRYVPGEVAPGVYSFVAASQQNWPHAQGIHGIRPFVSATREEWFDPEKFPGFDLSRHQ